MPRKAAAKKSPKKVTKKTSKVKLSAEKKKEPAGRVATAPPAASGSAVPVRVRMYRQGLGDCFLLTFDPRGNPVHMLIDCGTLGTVTNPDNKLAKVVDHIQKDTGGHLHLVVATHEHQDHVSGFHSLQEKFKGMNVDHVWMAWTENPDDDDAKKLGTTRDLGKALTLAAAALVKNSTDDATAAAMGEAVQSLLGFSGEALPDLGAGKFATTVDEAMTFVRTGFKSDTKKGTPAQTEYLSPGGAAIEPPWLPGFRFFILGPPRDMNRLHEMGDTGSDDIYGMTAGAVAVSGNSQLAFLAPEIEDEMPFDTRFRCLEDDQVIRPKLDAYFAETDKWRRVDNDWLHSAADLALQLDSLTNNTSLAMAIERISDGKVLLFPADAQQGHWLSWHEVKDPFTFTVGGVTRQTTAEKLLNKTVFYKVGHHSSHNATASRKGLEMMKQEDELVAFIPVDRAVALTRSPQGQWKMPANVLYRRLLEKCQGRIVRSDVGWVDDAKNAREDLKENEALFLNIAKPEEWEAWRGKQKAASVKIDPLFVEFELA